MTEPTPKRFALIGAAGYIAPRHMQAIRDTGNELVAAVDPNDSVGIIDSYFPQCRFFTEIERFDRHLEKLRRSETPVEYVGVCTPNYLHDAHSRLGLRIGAHVICEKPLVISPWNIDQLQEVEGESDRRIFCVLQLRLIPSLIALKDELVAGTHACQASGEKPTIDLHYVTRRGAWYNVSWKGAVEKSGGVAMNIGVHFFDLVGWLFGDVVRNDVHLRTSNRMAGFLELERANVRWFLSTDAADLPAEAVVAGKTAYRSMQIDGQEIEFTGFTDLHTTVYNEILAGRGFGLQEARTAIETVHAVNTKDVCDTPFAGELHPALSDPAGRPAHLRVAA